MSDLADVKPGDELDLSEFGVPTFTDLLLVTDAGIEETDDGRRWFVELEPQTEMEAKEQLPEGKVKDSGFMSHNERQDLVEMGMKALKRYFKAAFGKPQGSVDGLRGQTIKAQISEDDNGFTRVRKLQRAQ